MKLQRALLMMCCAAAAMLVSATVFVPDAQASQLSQTDKSNVLRGQLMEKAPEAGKGGPQGSAAYVEIKDGMAIKKKFRVQMMGLDPSTSYDVIVDDMTLGQMTTNKKGRGHFVITSMEMPGRTRGAIPDIGPGSVVRVGNAVGVLN